MSSAKWRQFCLGLNVLTDFKSLKPEEMVGILQTKIIIWDSSKKCILIESSGKFAPKGPIDNK